MIFDTCDGGIESIKDFKNCMRFYTFANTSNFKVSECLSFTGKIKPGNQFIAYLVFYFVKSVVTTVVVPLLLSYFVSVKGVY